MKVPEQLQYPAENSAIDVLMRDLRERLAGSAS
jgi:hypothetical protein